MKKIFAILLVILMLNGMFTACSGSTNENTDVTTPTPTSEPIENTGNEAEDYEFRMPIAENAVLSYWTTFGSTQITSPAEKACYIEMEKRTGVQIDWRLAPSANSSEAFNLMVMGGDYADLIAAGPATYTGGLDSAIENGVFIRLNEYVEKWAPNFLSRMNRDDATRRQQITDLGNIAYFGSIQNPQPAWVGPMMRQDWLDELGFETPVTYNDWYEILKAFRDQKGATMALTYTGFNGISESMHAGFNVGNKFYNENGTVKYGFIEDGFKNYLMLMNKWYTEKLIDQDFYTRVTEPFGASIDMMTKGTVGAFDYVYTMPHILAAMSGDPNYHVKAVPLPVQNVGDVAHFRRVNFELGDAGTALTPVLLEDTERLEIAVRWMDYRYTDEGSELITYGILGESYEYNENGEPQFTELVYKNPDGLSFNEAREHYGDMSGGQFYRWECENITVSEEELAAYDIWGQADGAWVMPPVTLTSEEGSEYSKLYGDIETFVTESIPKFITGTKPMSEWDSYVAQINKLGIDRCIEIYQNALNRYNAR